MNATVDIPSIIHEPVVYIMRHAEASGAAPEALITQKWAFQSEQLWEQLWWEHAQLFLVCNTTLERCKQTLVAIEKGFPHDSIKAFIDNEDIYAIADIVSRVKEILESGCSRDAIVVCVSDCQIGDVAKKLGHNHTFKILNQVMNSDNIVHHLSGLRICAHWVEAFKF